MMRILFVHSNYGKNALGGEVNVMNHEVQLLRKHGHYVEKFERTNTPSKLGTLINLLFLWFNPLIFFLAQRKLKRGEFDLIHVHNLWFSISFAMLFAARLNKVPVVFTLHNYRFACANSLFYNNGVCTKCLDGRTVRVLYEGCSNKINAFFSYIFLFQLRITKYYKNYVKAFIVLNEFTANIASNVGIEESRIYVKPNSISDSLDIIERQAVNGLDGNFALYVGRISEEKGVADMLVKWQNIEFPLKIVGPGVMPGQDNVEFLGPMSQSQVLHLMKKAKFLVFPSLWFEGMPLVLLEAMKSGLPVIATNLGGRSDLIKHGWNGYLYDPKEEQAMSTCVNNLLKDEALLQRMSRNMKKLYWQKYCEEMDYRRLLDVYEKFIR